MSFELVDFTFLHCWRYYAPFQTRPSTSCGGQAIRNLENHPVTHPNKEKMNNVKSMPTAKSLIGPDADHRTGNSPSTNHTTQSDGMRA
jgi:hypothetical protein